MNCRGWGISSAPWDEGTAKVPPYLGMALRLRLRPANAHSARAGTDPHKFPTVRRDAPSKASSWDAGRTLLFLWWGGGGGKTRRGNGGGQAPDRRSWEERQSLKWDSTRTCCLCLQETGTEDVVHKKEWEKLTNLGLLLSNQISWAVPDPVIGRIFHCLLMKSKSVFFSRWSLEKKQQILNCFYSEKVLDFSPASCFNSQSLQWAWCSSAICRPRRRTGGTAASHTAQQYQKQKALPRMRAWHAQSLLYQKCATPRKWKLSH